MSAAQQTCCGMVLPNGSYRTRECGKKASAEVDGKHYCGTHNPIKIAERRAAQQAIYDARSRAMDEASKKSMERSRRAECFPDLLAALKEIVKSLSDHDDEGLIEHAEQMIAARAAIKKAEGL